MSSDLSHTSESREREYAFFLSFSAFTGTFFFLEIYVKFQRTAWLSLIAGGVIAWLFLTFLIKRNVSTENHPLIRKMLSLLAIVYGGISLYAFFVFCNRCIFPGHSFIFFPICFLPIVVYGVEKGLFTLERTAKFTSVAVTILLILTILSTLQKIWDQRDYVMNTAAQLLRTPLDSFFIQTAIVTAILLCQSLILLQSADQTCHAPQLLRSVRRALIPGVLFSALLYLVAAIALGSYAFEYLTYPVYDVLSLPGYAEYLDRTEFLMLIIFLFCESCKTIAFLWAGRKLFQK